jgi:hypothetical protein
VPEEARELGQLTQRAEDAHEVVLAAELDQVDLHEGRPCDLRLDVDNRGHGVRHLVLGHELVEERHAVSGEVDCIATPTYAATAGRSSALTRTPASALPRGRLRVTAQTRKTPIAQRCSDGGSHSPRASVGGQRLTGRSGLHRRRGGAVALRASPSLRAPRVPGGGGEPGAQRPVVAGCGHLGRGRPSPHAGRAGSRGPRDRAAGPRGTGRRTTMNTSAGRGSQRDLGLGLRRLLCAAWHHDHGEAPGIDQ